MRTVWIDAADVDGVVDEGEMVTATRPISEWCLRGDDGGEPIPAGTLLEVLELRPWGKAMAQELPVAQDTVQDERKLILQAAFELEAEGLWEWE